MFRKVLVANRGEIAVRIIRALRELSIPSVAVYSSADRAALHVRMAHEAVHIGGSASEESYLRIDRILDAAHERGAEAIHPGYGFLSENPEFPTACEQAGLAFIGPPAAAIRCMGSKIEARRLARAAGAPVVPGLEKPVESAAEAARAADSLGYPVLLKAAAGGGGKGMRTVHSEAELAPALRDASSEAGRAFADPSVYIEKVIPNPRHIEIQVLGDHYGNLIHLGERECSIQRRHQKVVEECPSPLVATHPEMRAAMGEAALRIARAAGYANAGTVEFLVDSDRRFYFLEMNTRLQVEHPVTELVTGLDLVHLQIRLAAGERLPIRQEEVVWRGAALECRIYAEDPDNQFFPSPGRIVAIERPSGPGVRLDSGVYPGWTVPIEYDPLLAKLAVWASDRPAAVNRMLRALDEYHVSGIRTNLSFFRRLLRDDAFLAAEIDTGFIERFFRRPAAAGPDRDQAHQEVLALAAAIHSLKLESPAQSLNSRTASRWLSHGRGQLIR